jgi:hypothetical protein
MHRSLAFSVLLTAGTAALLAAPSSLPHARALALAARAATDGQTATWGTPEIIALAPLDPKSVSFTPSPSGNAGSFIFKGLTVEVGNPSTAFSATLSASVRVPVTTPAGRRLVGFRSDIRGFMSKSAGSRMLLVVDLGGGTANVEQTYGAEIPAGSKDSELARTVRSTIRLRRPETVAPECLLNLMLFAQRRSSTDRAVLTIDSVDVVPITR